MDARSILDALGKPKAIAAELGGIPPSTVAYWRHRNSIPAQWWPDIARLARRKGVEGVTVEALAAARAARARPHPTAVPTEAA